MGKARTPYQDTDWSLPENYEYRWRVSFWFDGPDHRYNGAGANISEASLTELINDFETALVIIQQLSTTNFSGTYNKPIGKLTNLGLEVVGGGGTFGLRFIMSNDSRRLSKTIPGDRLPQAIAELKNVPIRGPQLVEILHSVRRPS